MPDRAVLLYQLIIMVLSNELLEAARGHGDAPFALIKAYLDAGGDVDDADEKGDTMLYFHVAHENGDVHADDPFRILRLLLARGADVNKRSRYSGSTPLYQACNCENQAFGLGAIRCLIEAGANIDEKIHKGQFIESPLSNSLDWLRYDSVGWDQIGLSYVSLLLRYGPDLDECWGEDKSAEDCLRHIENPNAFPELEGIYHAHKPAGSNEAFLACKKLIADERHRRHLLQRKEVLRLRSLMVRGRAKKSSDAMIEPSFRLPDGVLWNVLSFWPPQRPKTFWRARAYDGPRPGCVFATRDGRTGYFVDVEPQVEYKGELDWKRVTDDGQTLSGALAPGYRGPGWLPGNPNWLSPNFWMRGGHD